MSDAERGSSAHQDKVQLDFEEEVPEQEASEIYEPEVSEIYEPEEEDLADYGPEQVDYQPEQTDDEPEEEAQAEEPPYPLPPRGIPYAIIAGIIAGGLGILLNLALTFLNAPLFLQASRPESEIAYNTALAVVGIQCVNFMFSVFVCFLAGYFVGKMAVQRRLGFYAGLIAGVLIYVVSLLVRYIPGYPGDAQANLPTESAGTTAGLITIVIFLFVWGFIGGLLSLWGAWMATRHHPYYAAIEEE